MNLVPLVNSLCKALCCATLVVSVFPLVMMPFRVFQAYRDAVRLELDGGEDAVNPLLHWMFYALLVIGVVFSLYQLGFVSHLLAVAAASACACLLACLCLLCGISAAIYTRIATGRRKSKRKMSTLGKTGGIHDVP